MLQTDCRVQDAGVNEDDQVVISRKELAALVRTIHRLTAEVIDLYVWAARITQVQK